MTDENRVRASTQEMALQRTEWALERTRLANERTLVAWLRTGIALVGFGAIVPRILATVEPQWLVNLISVLFVLVGTVTVVVGVNTYRKMTTRLASQGTEIAWWVVATMAAVAEVAAVLVLILFLLS